MPGQAHLKRQYHFEGTFDNHQLTTINIILYVFPWDIASILHTCCFGYFGHAWLCIPKVILSVCKKNFVFNCWQKNQFQNPCLSGYTAKICKLILGTLGMPGHIKPKCYYQPVFICMPKIKVIIHFFLEVLHFKETCNFIGCQYMDP